MAARRLIHQIDDQGVRTLTLDRPGAQNAIGPDLLKQLLAALDAAAKDDLAHVLVITGAGDMFSAGGNLDVLLASLDQPDSDREERGLAEALLVIERILRFEKPIIAMINGPVAGGGLALALACDLRIAATGAKFAYAYAMIGLAGDLGVNWLLGRLLGPARARYFAFTQRLDAEEALRLGLVDAVHRAENLAAETLAHARKLARLSPPALAAIKRNIDGASLSFGEATEMERKSFVALRRTSQHREAIHAMLDLLGRSEAVAPRS